MSEDTNKRTGDAGAVIAHGAVAQTRDIHTITTAAEWNDALGIGAPMTCALTGKAEMTDVDFERIGELIGEMSERQRREFGLDTEEEP